jgi:hypothetical protein
MHNVFEVPQFTQPPYPEYALSCGVGWKVRHSHKWFCIDGYFLKSKLIVRAFAWPVSQSCERFHKALYCIMLIVISSVILVSYRPVPVNGRLPSLCAVASAPSVAVVSIITGASQFPARASETWKNTLYRYASRGVSAIDNSQLYSTFPLAPLDPCLNHPIHISPIFFWDRIYVREVTKRPEPMSPRRL